MKRLNLLMIFVSTLSGCERIVSEQSIGASAIEVNQSVNEPSVEIQRVFNLLVLLAGVALFQKAGLTEDS
ncbi:MAG: hypothetical protein ABJZ83_05265 [Yoonia sp.]|uniref:hypothetical protein n=1 Tax=Yoonia sp. TaxID=2212373 RepID=UPI0032634D15